MKKLLKRIPIAFLLIVIVLYIWIAIKDDSHPKPYNILWITAESLQPKHLRVYGYDLETSPNIDNFAETGVLFNKVYNASAWTSESMVSNLLGVYSVVHGVDVRDKSIPDTWYTPLEILRDQGYAIPRMQSFQSIANFKNLGLTDDGSADDLVAWLEKHKDQRFFVWYHLLESHLPYTPPEEHKKFFWLESLVPNEESRKRIGEVQKGVLVVRDKVQFNQNEDAAAIRALYDGDIHFMDAAFGRVMKAVDRLGLRENTIIIFSTDHGEELLEHGFVGHASTAKGGTLYDEIIHVPLILSFPGHLPEGERVDTLVRSVDVMPTLFDLLGLPHGDYFQGESLLPLIFKSGPDRIAYASSSYKGYQEDNPKDVRDYMRSVRTREWKLIYRLWDLEKEEFFLYNLKDDPEELHNVSEDYPKILKEMKSLLYSWFAQSKNFEMKLESGQETFWSKLKSFFETVVGEKDVSALIAKAPSPPPIQYPKEGGLYSFDDLKGKIELKWQGIKGVPYLVEISAGKGDDKVDLTLKSDLPLLAQEISETYWIEYILLYQPVRFRVRINRPHHAWSPWRQFELIY